MKGSELLLLISKARNCFDQGLALNNQTKIIEALEIGLEIRRFLDSADSETLERLASEIDQFRHLDGGLNSFIYNCMKLTGKFEDMLPYLEKTVQYLQNDQNPDLWRQLGLLYMVQKQDLDKACEAWKRAINLDNTLVGKFPGLNVVYVYDAMKSQGKDVTYKIIYADLESGDFSVELSANGN
ncbi:MAG: hypothetical protein BAJATHORv1_30395 [Candidatus Thorarchaeota archaeon]|nr:MAG: hypothetical protein BAJATHORv1_30395 [Candidatus Thorarchaeota archaeon]